MNKVETLGAAIFCGLGILMIGGCEREGSAERMGKQIDQILEETQDKLEDLSERAEYNLRQAGDEVDNE